MSRHYAAEIQSPRSGDPQNPVQSFLPRECEYVVVQKTRSEIALSQSWPLPESRDVLVQFVERVVRSFLSFEVNAQVVFADWQPCARVRRESCIVKLCLHSALRVLSDIVVYCYVREVLIEMSCTRIGFVFTSGSGIVPLERCPLWIPRRLGITFPAGSNSGRIDGILPRNECILHSDFVPVISHTDSW